MGTAETPAAPSNGFILFFEKRLISFASNIPDTVLIINAIRPKAKINKTSFLRKVSAFIVAPTGSPKNIVTIFINSF